MKTADIISDLKYYSTEHNDITLWPGWTVHYKQLMNDHPNLVLAYNSLKLTKLTLEAILDIIENEYELT